MARWGKSAIAAFGAGLALVLLMAAGCQKKTEAQSPPEAPKAAAAADPENPNLGQVQVLTVRSDNPAVFVTGVFRDGVALPAGGLGSAQAKVKIAMDEDGVPCDSEGFEVRTSNAVIFHPLVNFCEAKWALTVPTRKASVPSPPPAADEELVWTTGSRDDEGGGKVATLVYGIPESDGFLFVASCQPGIQRAKFSINLPNEKVRRIDLAAPDRLLRYDLKVTPAMSEEAGPMGEIELPTGDALWTLLRRGSRLPYRLDEGAFGMVDATLGAEAIGKFLDTCNRDPAAAGV